MSQTTYRERRDVRDAELAELAGFAAADRAANAAARRYRVDADDVRGETLAAIVEASNGASPLDSAAIGRAALAAAARLYRSGKREAANIGADLSETLAERDGTRPTDSETLTDQSDRQRRAVAGRRAVHAAPQRVDVHAVADYSRDSMRDPADVADRDEERATLAAALDAIDVELHERATQSDATGRAAATLCERVRDLDPATGYPFAVSHFATLAAPLADSPLDARRYRVALRLAAPLVHALSGYAISPDPASVASADTFTAPRFADLLASEYRPLALTTRSTYDANGLRIPPGYVLQYRRVPVAALLPESADSATRKAATRLMAALVSQVRGEPCNASRAEHAAAATIAKRRREAATRYATGRAVYRSLCETLAASPLRESALAAAVAPYVVSAVSQAARPPIDPSGRIGLVTCECRRCLSADRTRLLAELRTVRDETELPGYVAAPHVLSACKVRTFASPETLAGYYCDVKQSANGSRFADLKRDRDLTARGLMALLCPGYDPLAELDRWADSLAGSPRNGRFIGQQSEPQPAVSHGPLTRLCIALRPFRALFAFWVPGYSRTQSVKRRRGRSPLAQIGARRA